MPIIIALSKLPWYSTHGGQRLVPAWLARDGALGYGDLAYATESIRRSSVSFQDKQLTCVECGEPFIFSGEDQAYHSQRGFTNEPKRCPDCRDKRRSARGSSGGSMGMSQSGRDMYPATCAQCGKETMVPFQPRGDRPVYCSDCFRTQPNYRGGRSR
jgi:CxxC-x17-CxxC domain-containing protein